MHSQPKGSGKSSKDYSNKDKGRLAIRDNDYQQEPPYKVAKLSDIGHYNQGKSAGKPSGSGSSKDREALMKMLSVPGDKSNISLEAMKSFQTESRIFWKEFCRNCFVAGKGFVKHTLHECQLLGNTCNLRCQKCREGNHWMNQCPLFHP